MLTEYGGSAIKATGLGHATIGRDGELVALKKEISAKSLFLLPRNVLDNVAKGTGFVSNKLNDFLTLVNNLNYFLNPVRWAPLFLLTGSNADIARQILDMTKAWRAVIIFLKHIFCIFLIVLFFCI